MGKNKQAQRTKNNTRPSNSSRSAELLGSAIPNFVGFSAINDGGYIPVPPGLSLCSSDEVEMSSVDSNFQVILKKMNKKDATTKYKALQEFAILCQDMELSTVEGMLPFWPRLYCALSIDIDHRVREGAQLAHAAVVKRVGKGTAMYLKQLAGAWFTSQYDTYPPAASAAVNSFNDTFPSTKMVNAIVHCQQEILTYISNNIIVNTAETLSAHKSLTSEEMEARYHRVLVANLQGYSSYFKKVPPREIEETLEIHDKILSSSKFWKLAKHDALPVKTAFFNLLTSIMENAEKLLQSEKKKTVTTIMNSLDESEPGILSAVWESMLVATTKIDDWYLVVNVDKLGLPKLWHVLRSGGQGCASIIYPNLLPLIDQFPKLTVDIDNLYINFFDNMRQGFAVKSVQMSRTETLAVATSFVECLRYSILVNAENINLSIRLLKEQLMPVIEASVTDGTIAMRQFCFAEIAILVRYWSENRTNKAYKSYVSLMQQFWLELRLLFDRLLNIPRKISISHTVDAKDPQIEFLLSLKNVPDRTHKKLKVKFSENRDSVAASASQSPEVKVVDINTDMVFSAELCEFVNALWVIYFNKIKDQRYMEYMVEQLSKLTKHFASPELFVALSQSLGFNDNFFQFYDESLKYLLLKALLMQNSRNTGQIVELIFDFFAYTNDAEKEKVLESLVELDDVAITKNVIRCSLSRCNSNDRMIKVWLARTEVTELLIAVAKEIVRNCTHDDMEGNHKLILLTFKRLEMFEGFLSNRIKMHIVSILYDSVHETWSMQFITFIRELMMLMWNEETTCNKNKAYAMRILTKLFELCIQEYDDSTIAYAAYDSYKQGLARSKGILCSSEYDNFLSTCISDIWTAVYRSHASRFKDTLVNLAIDIAEMINNDHLFGSSQLFFSQYSNISSLVAESIVLSAYGEIITGNLHMSDLKYHVTLLSCFPYLRTEDVSIDMIDIISIDTFSVHSHWTSKFSHCMTRCLLWSLFTIDLLKCVYKRTDFDNKDIYAPLLSSNGIEMAPCKFDMWISNFPVYTIICVICVAEIYTKHYKSTEEYNDVNILFDSLKSSFVDLQKYFTKSIYDSVLSQMKTFSDIEYMLPYVIRTIARLHIPHIESNEINENPFEFYESCSKRHGRKYDEESYVQAIQVLSDYWTPENIPLLTDKDVSMLISVRVSIKNEDSVDIAIMEKIMFYDKKILFILFERDASSVSWDQLLLSLEVIRLLTTLVEKVPSKLKREHWDFILISLTMWQRSLLESKDNYAAIPVTALITAVSQLYYALETLIDKHEREPIMGLPSTFLDEWRNVFAGDIHSGIVQIWMVYATLYSDSATAKKCIVPLDYLGKAISVLNGDILFEKDDKRTETINFDKMLKLSLNLLQSPVRGVQLGAYHILKHMASKFVERDKILVESADSFEPSNLDIKKLEETLLSTENIVNMRLMKFKLCDTISCTIHPFTDSYTCTLEYLLIWVIVLDMCAKAHSDLRYQYAEILKKQLFPCLLNNIFKLMPVEVLQDNKNKTVKLLEMFTTLPSFNFGESWTESRLDHIVCYLYTNCLRHLPVLVRQWLSTTDSRVSATIDKITSRYVSPMLCQEELVNNLVNVENMQIKVHPTAREVVALYQMDDTKLELSIVLPPNHPLGMVKVEPGQYAGGTANWRNCHMQLSIFLTHQNGSVWDGLIMWKRNLDKKFAGVEECYICFSIFHVSTYQIPKLSCHTCRKKFHTPCLYKWFNTSQKSTCPICRNVF